MGGHHKKKIRAEKAKVKLKGSKLPKGLNVTKTEFKVKKIQIRGQLKEYGHIQGQKQINIKETLNKLRHHGLTFRLDALRILREAILIGHEAILQKLQEVIQSISSICLDIERDSRRESVKVLSQLLSTLSVEAVTPFFHVISSYLRCAMTHIQPNIQEDSLLILDVLLTHVPELVAEKSEKIFEDFLHMISRVRAEGESHRTLTINMGQRQTTIKWRAKVLQRLQLMLKTQCQMMEKVNKTKNTATTYQIHSFNAKTPQYFSLKRPYDIADISNLFILPIINAKNDTNEQNGSLNIRFYIEHLMPLLLEAWLEVKPQENTNSSSSMGAHLLLSQDAGITLNIILDIIRNLWTLIDLCECTENTESTSKWFQKKHADGFASNFLHLTAFPYQQSEQDSIIGTSRSSAPKSIAVGGQFCKLQNITLTYLMLRFFQDSISKKTTKYFVVLLEYLHSIVNELEQNSSSEHLHVLILTLRTALVISARGINQLLSEKLCQLLQATIDAFLHHKFSNKEQSSVLVLLCEIINDINLLNMYGKSKFDEFLRFLPQILLKPTITQNALISMLNMCKQQNITFLKALSPYLVNVIENIMKIQVQGAINAFEGKKYVMNLFYWIEQPENIDELCEKVKSNITDKRISSYFIYVIRRY